MSTIGRLSLLLWICWLPLCAQEAGLTPKTRKAIEEAVAAARKARPSTGLTVAVGVKGSVRYARGFGMADLENQVPANATTRYRTASIAKPMTAVGVMQLAERGKLDLDAPIRKYCPQFPKKRWPLTARQLLGHLGGVRHYKRLGEASGTRFFNSLKGSLDTFKDDPLLHEPGTSFHYTTYGYTLLGCAIEAASGLTYEAYMRKHVFDQASMKLTCIDHQFGIVPERARGYARLNQRLWRGLSEEARKSLKVGDVVNASLHDTSMKIPGGGLLSTAPDLVRFGMALLAGRLVKPETLKSMWTPQKTKGGEEIRYGLGFRVRMREGGRVVRHSGGQAGAACLLVIHPERRTAIALMSNLQGSRLNGLAGEIDRLLGGASR